MNRLVVHLYIHSFISFITFDTLSLSIPSIHSIHDYIWHSFSHSFTYIDIIYLHIVFCTYFLIDTWYLYLPSDCLFVHFTLSFTLYIYHLSSHVLHFILHLVISTHYHTSFYICWLSFCYCLRDLFHRYVADAFLLFVVTLHSDFDDLPDTTVPGDAISQLVTFLLLPLQTPLLHSVTTFLLFNSLRDLWWLPHNLHVLLLCIVLLRLLPFWHCCPVIITFTFYTFYHTVVTICYNSHLRYTFAALLDQTSGYIHSHWMIHCVLSFILTHSFIFDLFHVPHFHSFILLRRAG